MKIAVVGASGFVGTRLVEQLALGGDAEVVPVVRRYASLAVLARFDLPWRVCDIFDSTALAEAFRGCDVVVHAALGDASQIVRMAETVYEGAGRAGVKRLVALSTAAVHGLAPASGTSEDSPIRSDQGMEYNDAKVRAERALWKLREKGRTELTMLRPSIVYGPRSRLIGSIARQLVDGTAFLIDGGGGICNGIYVDNLISAILLASSVREADGEVFLVGDREGITWRRLYAGIAAGLGVSMDTVHEIPAPVFRKSWKQKVDSLVTTGAVQAVLPAFPFGLKKATKTMLKALAQPPPPEAWTLPARPGPNVTEEMTLLQQCAWKLSNEKSARILGYAPGVSFATGLERTIGWLEFAGYPIVRRLDAAPCTP